MTNWHNVWMKQHPKPGVDHEKAYTYIASNYDAADNDITMRRLVVMAITLDVEALQTRVVGEGSMLLIYLNAHPRPSFMFHPNTGIEPLIECIKERFGFDARSAYNLASCMLQTLPKDGRDDGLRK